MPFGEALEPEPGQSWAQKPQTWCPAGSALCPGSPRPGAQPGRASPAPWEPQTWCPAGPALRPGSPRPGAQPAGSVCSRDLRSLSGDNWTGVLVLRFLGWFMSSSGKPSTDKGVALEKRSKKVSLIVWSSFLSSSNGPARPARPAIVGNYK